MYVSKGTENIGYTAKVVDTDIRCSSQSLLAKKAKTSRYKIPLTTWNCSGLMDDNPTVYAHVAVQTCSKSTLLVLGMQSTEILRSDWVATIVAPCTSRVW